MTTVILVDDHKIVRQGLRILLTDEDGIEVIGEAAKAEDGIALAEELEPDIVICDLLLNGLNGIEVTRELRKRVPDTKVIILSMYNDPGYIARAMREGAKGWVLKGSGIDELISAIRLVVAGGRYLSPSAETKD